MILQALYEYYQRKAADPESGIAPVGLEWKDIPFVIVISKEGRFVALEDTRESDGKTDKPRRFLLPQSQGRSGTKGWAKAFLLWDHAGYVLGYVKPDDAKSKALAPKQHEAFVNKLRSLPQDVRADPSVAAVMAFYEKHEGPSSVLRSEQWSECEKLPSCNLTFRVDGNETTVAERPAVRRHVAESTAATADDGLGACLVSGIRGPTARTHPVIRGVRGANVVGATLSSFNLSAATSYGKEQNYNAPVSEEAAFAYTTALNSLLSRDSKNKLLLGDATVVFWSDRGSTLDDTFAALFSLPTADDPDADVRAVASLYRSIQTGALAVESDRTFYVLGLAPNAARLSVRFFHRARVPEMATRLRQHFDDLEVVMPKGDRGSVALPKLLVEIATERKLDNIPPNLAGDVARAVLEGGPYPQVLLQQTVRRIRADQTVNRIRAALLKATLNRFRRTYPNHEKEMTVSLDPANQNAGYRLGRLFAVLEKIQEEANPGINATIRERFYGAASASPVAVFPQLLKLKNHHLAKLERPGRKINLERLLAEVFEGLAEFPAHLAMEDQARFAIGYYHQRQALFTKSDSNSKQADSNEEVVQ